LVAAVKLPVFGYRQEHQKLIDTRYRRPQHFEFLEKNRQFYTDFGEPRNVVLSPGTGCLRPNGNIAITKSTAAIAPAPRSLQPSAGKMNDDEHADVLGNRRDR
jgi:hypothetical protein